MSRHTMPTARLAELLGRLAIAISAGIDLRRAWASETDRSPRRWQPALAEIRNRLASGEPLSQAMRAAGGVVWLVVAGVIILVIFRIFSSYVGMINEAARGI